MNNNAVKHEIIVTIQSFTKEEAKAYIQQFIITVAQNHKVNTNQIF